MCVWNSGDSPMRCPTGELNGFPRRKSMATAAATRPENQLTANRRRRRAAVT